MKKLLSILALAGVFAFSAQAQFHIPTTTGADLAGGLTTVAGSTNKTLTTYAYPSANGVSFWGKLALTNAGTENTTFTFSMSGDGANWISAQTNTVASTGTTGVLFKIDIAAATIQNAAMVKVDVANGHASTLFLTNLVYTTWR